MPAIYLHSVLPALREWRAQGLRTALVTLVASDGSAPRPVGSQMAIAENGKAVGNITGGCAEAAIVAEAQARIARGQNGCVRYGAGSPYIDIRLPCGSGIDVYFDVDFTDTSLDALLAAQAARLPATLEIDGDKNISRVLPGAVPVAAGCHTRCYAPVARLVIAGKGPLVPILARLAGAADFEVFALSSEPETLEAVAPHALLAEYLATPQSFRYTGFDRWTAFVSLFHEHEWEPPILQRALDSACFYVGALGSRRTAAQRVGLLREIGVPEDAIARLHAPVGLQLGGHNPPEIAIAILAEIIQVQHAAAPGASRA
jgi:xanthine dehydrogenase accessory factor